MLNYRLQTENDTDAFCQKLLPLLESPCVIYLHGDLGAGKTTLSQYLIRAAGHKGPVKSPTYTLFEEYQTPHGHFYHFDLYRLKDAEELIFIGIEDIAKEKAIFLIEWPEQGAEYLPNADLAVYIKLAQTDRELSIESTSEKGSKLLEQL